MRCFAWRGVLHGRPGMSLSRVFSSSGAGYTSPPVPVGRKKVKQVKRVRKQNVETTTTTTSVAQEEEPARVREYRKEYYQKNRDKLLERNRSNRAARSALQKAGIVATGQKGRPKKKRADVDHDDDVMSPEELQAEIRRHEEQHEQWLRELEANRADLMRMYEEEGVDDSVGSVGDDEVEEGFQDRQGPLSVSQAVQVMKKSGARGVVALDLRHKTDLCEYMLMCTCDNRDQMRRVTDELFREIARRKKYHTMPRVEGRNSDDWVLIDCGFMMVHVFEERTRRKYNLESLWALRPSAEELAVTQDFGWEDDLFEEFSEMYMQDEDEDDGHD